MDAFSPDFVPFWTVTTETADEHAATVGERLSDGEEQALVELAERVVAARSIV